MLPFARNPTTLVLLLTTILLGLYLQTTAATCVPPNCDDGNPCTIDKCVQGTCSNTAKVCVDNNPCTQDTCVNGVCVFTPNCTISKTATPPPSPSATPSKILASATSSPLVQASVSPTSTPNPVSQSVTRSRVVINPSSVSPIIEPSASPSGGIPSGFPIQSASNTFVPSATLAATRSGSSTISFSPTITPSAAASGSNFASFSLSASRAAPSASPTSHEASPLPYRLGAPTTVLVQVACSGGSCCTDFAKIWTNFVPVNYIDLVDVLTCDTINSKLLAITYNQFGSNFHDAHQILKAYWLEGGCGSQNPLTDGPCFPTQGDLASSEWTAVIEMNVLTGNYITSYHNAIYYYNYYFYYVQSSAAILAPTVLLLLSFVLL